MAPAWLPGEFREQYRKLLLIRRFEERLVRLFGSGVFPGHYHLYVGQEATGVAFIAQLRPDDTLFTTHRNHGHLLARGADPGRMLAEILGREGGYCQGKGGTLHLAAAALNVPHTSGLVGGSLPLATGAAVAARRLGGSRVVVCFFGDAVLEEGSFYEAVNMAALWRLPIIYVCENNSVPPEQRAAGQYPSSSLAARQLADVPAAFQVPTVVGDGADLTAMHALFADVLGRVRAGAGPHFIETRNTRWPGNYPNWPELVGGETRIEWFTGEAEPPAVIADWSRRSDPLYLALASGLENGYLDLATVRALDADVRVQLAAAEAWARQSPPPEPAAAYSHVFAGKGAP